MGQGKVSFTRQENIHTLTHRKTVYGTMQYEIQYSCVMRTRQTQAVDIHDIRELSPLSFAPRLSFVKSRSFLGKCELEGSGMNFSLKVFGPNFFPKETLLRTVGIFMQISWNSKRYFLSVAILSEDSKVSNF